MKIFVDSDFKCHVNDDGTMTAVETDFFDGKCTTFIEGYRFVPSGENWERSDAVVFYGEMIAPLSDEVKADIETGSDDTVDVDVDDFSEEDFDELGESYLKKVYEKD